MPRPAPPPEIDIPSLRRQQVRMRNLMEAGSGTPWEDRGHIGTIGAFVRTCLMGMFRPVKLVHLIRRPETDGDTRWFAAGCGILWGVALTIHTLLMLWQAGQEHRTYINWGVATLEIALQLLIVPLALLMLLKLHSSLFNTLSATELKGRAPAVLTFNVFSYSLGASLMAVVPFAGPPLAVAWIFVAMVLVALKRLHLRAASAVIGVALSIAAVLGLAAGLYFGGGLLFDLVTGGSLDRL